MNPINCVQCGHRTSIKPGGPYYCELAKHPLHGLKECPKERVVSLIGDKEDVEEIYRRYEQGDPVARFLLDHTREVEETPR